MNLTTLIRENPGLNRCALCRAYGEMSEDQRQKLLTVLSGADFSYKLISEALRGEGFSISPSVVRKHALGECSGAVRYR